MSQASRKANPEQVTKFADMFSAMGTEARLRIVQLLLTAHPEGLVVSEIQEELDIPNSTLSHHLEKLKAEGDQGEDVAMLVRFIEESHAARQHQHDEEAVDPFE